MLIDVTFVVFLSPSWAGRLKRFLMKLLLAGGRLEKTGR